MSHVDKINEAIFREIGAMEWIGINKFSDLKPEHRFIDDLCMDSLDMIEMLIAVEEVFDVEVPDGVAGKWNTVGDVYAYFEQVNKTHKVDNSGPLILISECDDVEFLRDAVQKLWGILDDIDSIGDVAKGDDKVYRDLVENKQKERWAETNIVSDGHKIYRKI